MDLGLVVYVGISLDGILVGTCSGITAGMEFCWEESLGGIPRRDYWIRLIDRMPGYFGHCSGVKGQF